jgi:hypothetical protein
LRKEKGMLTATAPAIMPGVATMPLWKQKPMGGVDGDHDDDDKPFNHRRAVAGEALKLDAIDGDGHIHLLPTGAPPRVELL